jgi:hypothetical protein
MMIRSRPYTTSANCSRSRVSALRRKERPSAFTIFKRRDSEASL